MDSSVDSETAGMKEALLRYRKEHCGKFVASIFDSLVAFSGRGQFEDDICMVCVDT